MRSGHVGNTPCERTTVKWERETLMRRSMTSLAGIGVFISGIILAAGALAQTPVTFQLNWTAGGPNAGFAAAAGEGYYKQAGLDVTIVQGNGSGNTVQLVASGRAQLAYADAGGVAQRIGKGAPRRARPPV